MPKRTMKKRGAGWGDMFGNSNQGFFGNSGQNYQQQGQNFLNNLSSSASDRFNRARNAASPYAQSFINRGQSFLNRGQSMLNNSQSRPSFFGQPTGGKRKTRKGGRRKRSVTKRRR